MDQINKHIFSLVLTKIMLDCITRPSPTQTESREMVRQHQRASLKKFYVSLILLDLISIADYEGWDSHDIKRWDETIWYTHYIRNIAHAMHIP